MKVLVTGATGNVGRAVVQNLISRGVAVRALVREEATSNLPSGVEVAIGDLTEPSTIRAAMHGVDKLFLLNGVVADELTQALITYGIAKRSGVRHITYLSVYRSEQFRDVPHFASKHAVEEALRQFGVPFTILKPGYFFQNDLQLKDALETAGVYPMPLGEVGIACVDIRDIGEAAARALTGNDHEGRTYDLVSSSQISGPGNAALWSQALGRPVAYAGHDFDAWEKQISEQIPSWMAYDMRSMLQGYFERGFASTTAEVEQFNALLGRTPNTYEAFVEETVATWKKH